MQDLPHAVVETEVQNGHHQRQAGRQAQHQYRQGTLPIAVDLRREIRPRADAQEQVEHGGDQGQYHPDQEISGDEL